MEWLSSVPLLGRALNWLWRKLSRLLLRPRISAPSFGLLASGGRTRYPYVEYANRGRASLDVESVRLVWSDADGKPGKWDFYSDEQLPLPPRNARTVSDPAEPWRRRFWLSDRQLDCPDKIESVFAADLSTWQLQVWLSGHQKPLKALKASELQGLKDAIEDYLQQPARIEKGRKNGD